MELLKTITQNQVLWYGWISLAVIVFIFSLKVTAPYGRHIRKGWGPVISNKTGWVLMELPALTIVPLLFFVSDTSENIHIVLAFLWLLHYVHRTLIFPFLTQTNSKSIPLVIVLMGVVFNGINGIIVGSVFFSPANAHPILIVVGLSIFALGMFINVTSDYFLIGLRKASGKEYVIPKGKWFETVSCPNHFGEILEWLGFSLIAFHVGPMLFFIWTAANLIPRSIAHHRWYKGKFPNYPKKRKAVLPYLL